MREEPAKAGSSGYLVRVAYESLTRNERPSCGHEDIDVLLTWVDGCLLCHGHLAPCSYVEHGSRWNRRPLGRKLQECSQPATSCLSHRLGIGTRTSDRERDRLTPRLVDRGGVESQRVDQIGARAECGVDDRASLVHPL